MGMRCSLLVSLALLAVMAAEATADDAPTAATRSLLRELADGRRSFESLIDEDRGLVVIDHAGGEADRPDVERRLCTPADRKSQLVRLQRAMPSYLTPDDEGVVHAWCRNRPGPPTCVLEGFMEFVPTVTLTFAVDPVRGLRLREVMAVDHVGVAEDVQRSEKRRIRRARARLAATTCAATRP
jgi:hypothetical protein